MGEEPAGLWGVEGKWGNVMGPFERCERGGGPPDGPVASQARVPQYIRQDSGYGRDSGRGSTRLRAGVRDRGPRAPQSGRS